MGVSKCQWIFVQQKISKEVVRTPQLELFKFVLGIVRDRYNIVLESFSGYEPFFAFQASLSFFFLSCGGCYSAGIAFATASAISIFQRSHIGLLINAAHDRFTDDFSVPVHNTGCGESHDAQCKLAGLAARIKVDIAEGCAC